MAVARGSYQWNNFLVFCIDPRIHILMLGSIKTGFLTPTEKTETVGSTFLFKFSFLQLIVFHNTHHIINIYFNIRTCFSLHPFLLDWECDFHLQWSWDNWWTGRVWFGRVELVGAWCLYTGAEDWTFYFFWQWTNLFCPRILLITVSQECKDL